MLGRQTKFLQKFRLLHTLVNGIPIIVYFFGTYACNNFLGLKFILNVL